MHVVQLHDLGIQSYAEVLTLQELYFNQLLDNKHNGVSNNDLHKLIICEHFPVITLGKSANKENVLLSKELLAQQNIDLFEVNRGGDVTLHAPNQLVGYPILDLEYFSTDLKWYMRQLEEIMIRTIAHFGIEGYRIDGATGVWVNSIVDNQPKKIAAFGVKTSRWITMHGFSLNVSNDLGMYRFIHPCGFVNKGVTSIQQELDSNVDIKIVKEYLLIHFKEIFNIKFS